MWVRSWHVACWCQWIIASLDANAFHKTPPQCAAVTTLQQLLRFCVVGVGLNVSLFFVYLLLVDTGATPKIAMTAVYVSGVTLGFMLHRKWSFVSRSAPMQDWVGYVAVCLGGYVLNLSVLWLCVDRLGWAHGWVQGAMVLVVAGLTFSLNKVWVFRASSR